jgi:hypothetical protein
MAPCGARPEGNAMPQIDISTDSLTRLNTVAEKDYQGASFEQAWTDCSASTRSTSPSRPRPARENASDTK